MVGVPGGGEWWMVRYEMRDPKWRVEAGRGTLSTQFRLRQLRLRLKTGDPGFCLAWLEKAPRLVLVLNTGCWSVEPGAWSLELGGPRGLAQPAGP